MIAIAITAILGALALLCCCTYFLTQASRKRAEVLQTLRAETNELRRKANLVEQAFIEKLVDGQPVDPAINDYQRERAQPPFGRWDWGNNELLTWERQQAHERQEDINRQLFPKALGIALGIVALTAVIAGVLYSQLAITNGSNSTPPGIYSAPPVNAPLPPTTGGFNPII